MSRIIQCLTYFLLHPPKYDFTFCDYRIWTTLIWRRIPMWWMAVVMGPLVAPWAPLLSTGSMEVICPRGQLLPPARPTRELSPLHPWPSPLLLGSLSPPKPVALCRPLLEAPGPFLTQSSSSTRLPVSFPREWTPARERWVQDYGSGTNLQR